MKLWILVIVLAIFYFSLEKSKQVEKINTIDDRHINVYIQCESSDINTCKLDKTYRKGAVIRELESGKIMFKLYRIKYNDKTGRFNEYDSNY